MLSIDRAALGRLNTKSLQEKMEEKAKLLVIVDVDFYIVSVSMHSQVDSAFYPPWDSKMSTSQ